MENFGISSPVTYNWLALENRQCGRLRYIYSSTLSDLSREEIFLKKIITFLCKFAFARRCPTGFKSASGSCDFFTTLFISLIWFIPSGKNLENLKWSALFEVLCFCFCFYLWFDLSIGEKLGNFFWKSGKNRENLK